MAATSGTENFALIRQTVEDRLFSEPYSFEFVQAVRLLHQFYPHRAAIGFFQSPASEAVRFGVRPSLSFPASEVHELEQLENAPPLMRVNFMGTVGPLGLLPLYYTELVADRLKERDRTLRDFLDIFHHRIISLFYRAWVKHHFPVQYERGGGDNFSYYLSGIIGLGTPGLETRQQTSDESLRFYAGLFAQQPRSAEALKLMLRDFFRVSVEVEQFLGAWYRLEADSQCNLDDAAEDSQMLGFGTIVGDEIWDPQSRIRVVLGPLPLKRYLDFLPSGTAYPLLRSLVRFFAGDEFDFEAQLILRREEVPVCELGSGGDLAPLLGWVSWSSTRPMDYNPSQTILQL
jgi:type VI secretion system protein ImpH